MDFQDGFLPPGSGVRARFEAAHPLQPLHPLHPQPPPRLRLRMPFTTTAAKTANINSAIKTVGRLIAVERWIKKVPPFHARRGRLPVCREPRSRRTAHTSAPFLSRTDTTLSFE